MDLTIAIPFFLVAALFIVVLYQLTRIEKELSLIRTLVAAFMEHQVSGTVAEHKLAAAVQEANKNPAAMR